MVYLEHIMARDPRIRVVGIAGPGDPFANAEATMDTLRRVRKAYPDMLLCVASNGLNVAPFAEELAALAVSHVTITINAVDPAIGAEMHAWVRDGKHVLRGLEAAETLLAHQLEAISAMKRLGMVVKVNTIVVPDVNDHHAMEVAKVVGQMGVDILNCLPLYPAEGSAFEHMPEPAREDMARLRQSASAHVPQMEHCARCRADAVGLLQEGAAEGTDLLTYCACLPLEPEADRPRVAVGSMEGVLVNQHLGEARELWVYEQAEDGFRLVEQRTTPEPGGAEGRWEQLTQIFNDCAAIIVSGAGGQPKRTLAGAGIRLVVTEGVIESILRDYYTGAALPVPSRPQKCGVGCSGDGMGCG
jgi:nitrogen fixation protein NifB